METSKCCEAPVVREYLHNLQEKNAQTAFSLEIPVEVCTVCGSILFAHPAHVEEQKKLVVSAR